MTLSEVIQRQERERIVHNMLQRGYDHQSIADVTDLSLEEIALMAKKAS